MLMHLQGNTVVVLKALGQENIDDLLKLSEDYKKSESGCTRTGLVWLLTHITGEIELESGHVVEERREETIIDVPPPPHSAPPAQLMPPPPIAQPPPPIFMTAPPPPPPPPETVMEKRTVIREVSPARSYTTTHSGTTHTSATPYIVDVRRREEISDEVPVGTMALVKSERHRSRSASRSHRDHRMSEVRELQRRHHEGSREVVKAERLSSGELVLWEEQVERIEEPRRGVRIEKDKKGRMSISVPKYR